MGTPLYSRFGLIVCLLLAFSAFELGAQDIHFTQFGNSHLNLNPALTGSFNGLGRINANYRSQWNEVPVEYQTFTLAYDMKFSQRLYRKPFRLRLIIQL